MHFAVIAATLLPLLSCGSGDKTADETGDTLTVKASLLKMIDHGEYISASVTDPWNDGKILQKYYLVHRDSVMPNLPDDGTVIRTPIKSAAVFSSIHSSAIDELGQAATIKAVADGQYFTDPTVIKALADGRIKDIGPSQSPSLESLIDISPEVVILSPYQNSDHSAISKSGIAVIQMADYMENTPLGRAEWLLFLGALYGKLDQAQSIYNDVCATYNSLAADAPSDTVLVLTETPASGVWYCPAGGSYAARLIADAGGKVIFADDPRSGSVPADYSTVYDRAIDADVWLIRSFGPLSRNDLARMSPLISGLKPFVNNRIYVCDSSRSRIFDDTAFHPERVLAEYINIFANKPSALRYFKTIE